MNPITLRAHYDGEKIVLDDQMNLQPDTKLIVTVLPSSKNKGGSGLDDQEYEGWTEMSARGLGFAYEDDEEEYAVELIKETNPDYAGG